MKLENQVCSLELAKKLKELGVKQESYFYWQEFEGQVALRSAYRGNELPRDDRYSAFTVAELGEMLPMIYTPVKDINGFKEKWLWVNNKAEKHWENTEADARAKILIYLLENNT